MGQPILKWAGGKHQLLSEIISLFPENYSELSYHEPFLGSGAVFFHARVVKTGARICARAQHERKKEKRLGCW